MYREEWLSKDTNTLYAVVIHKLKLLNEKTWTAPGMLNNPQLSIVSIDSIARAVQVFLFSSLSSCHYCIQCVSVFREGVTLLSGDNPNAEAPDSGNTVTEGDQCLTDTNTSQELVTGELFPFDDSIFSPTSKTTSYQTRSQKKNQRRPKGTYGRTLGPRERALTSVRR